MGIYQSFRHNFVKRGSSWWNKGLALLFGVGLALLPLVSYAVPIETIPNPRQIDGTWITDMAEVLTSETKSRLNQRLSELEAESGVEFAIVTVADVQPYATPKEFTTELFNQWGIGKVGEDNGLLMLVSIGDRRVEIETGYGIEGILPDAKIGTIIDQAMIPQFRAGNLEAGILAGVEKLLPALRGHQGLGIMGLNRSLINLSTIFWGLVMIAGFWGARFCYNHARTLAYTPILLPPQGVFRWSSQAQDEQSLWGWTWLSACSGLYGVILWGMAAISAKDLFSLLLPTGIVSGVVAVPITQQILRRRLRPNPRSRSRYPFQCQVCHEPMEWVEPAIVNQSLNSPQQVAARLGSTVYEGWRCLSCSTQIEDGFHLISFPAGTHIRCPMCEEDTVEQTTEVIAAPTYDTPGRELRSQFCHCCSYTNQKEYSIAKLEPPSHSSNSSYSAYSDSSSSSSSDFGGGSSGGGGAGGSW